MSSTLFRSLALAAIACAIVAPCRASSQPPAVPPPSVPAAIAVETKTDAARTRLTFTLSEPVEVRSFVLEGPDRAVLEMPELNFQLPPEAGRGREGVVTSFRYGLFAPGRSRVVIDLAQPATISLVDVTPGASEGSFTLVLELTRTDRESFRRATRIEDPVKTGSIAGSQGKDAAADLRRTIVLDPGHGGTDPGAIASSGAFEKDIVFGFAQRLRRSLEASGRYKVVMTRDHDVFIPLRERVRIAQGAKADLFISLHADSISAAPHIRGSTVYTGAERATDPESARLAERENKADAAGGHNGSDTPTEIADILQELTVRETRGLSHRFAKRLLGAIKPVMPLSKKPQREAGFAVLRAPDVPSVLLELGYLSSSKDIGLLTSDAWRDRSAEAVTAAINLYFGARVAGRDIAPVLP